MAEIDFAKFASRALSAPTRAPDPWRDPDIWAADKLIGGEVNTTTRLNLFGGLQNPVHWDFIVADIEDGQRWLASRLFIFAVLLKELRDLQFVVVVESVSGVPKRLLGVTTPDHVRSAFAASYPWFEDRLVEGAHAAKIGMFRSRMSVVQARTILDAFIDGLQRTTPPNIEIQEWSALGNGNLWERSPWLTNDKVTLNLSSTFFDDSTIQRESIEKDFSLYRDIMRRQAPCVAVVNAKGEFLDLFPKQSILDRFLGQINSAMNAIHLYVGEGGEIVMGDKTESHGSTTTFSGSHQTFAGVNAGPGAIHVGNITQNINSLVNNNKTKEVGEALAALTSAIQSDANIDATKKQDLLKDVDKLTQHAAEPPEKMDKGTIKSLIDSFAGLCAGAGGLAAVWTTWGPAISRFFGV
jgi:hypothetical protein